MSEKAPSFLDMMKNFTKDVIDYAKEGAPHVTTSQYNERLRVCGNCPHLKRDTMRCGKCGCIVEHKAKWGTTTCPDDRWDLIKKKAGVNTHKKVKLKTKDSGKSAHTKTSK